MTTPPRNPRRTKTVRFSPVLLAVALTPVFLQTSTISCKSGITTLSELEVIVDGQDIVDGFDPDVRDYSAAVPPGTDEAMVHAMSTDPNAQVWIDVVVDGERERYLHGGLGGGDMIVSLPPGPSTIEVWVRAPKGASGVYAVDVETATAFPCTEQGILDAIATGGGPHTFDCNGPTTVVTQGEIIIDNDVILDGEGNLTIDRGMVGGPSVDERVFSVPVGTTVELAGMTVRGGFVSAPPVRGGGILNEGTLRITDSIVQDNHCIQGGEGFPAEGGEIYSSGSLTVLRSSVQKNFVQVGSNYNSLRGAGIAGTGAFTLIDSQVSDNSTDNGAEIWISGTLTLIKSTVAGDIGSWFGIRNDGTTNILNSTITSSGLYAPLRQASGTLTIIGSTVASDGATLAGTIALGTGVSMVVENSVIVGSESTRASGTCTGAGSVVSGGGNIESPTNDCGLTDPTDLVNVSADELKLGPLADNGGPTMTHGLLPGSIAIDRIPPAMCVDANGQPLTTDQRGVARPQGGACDVGAFEWADCSGTACDDGNDCTADYCDPSDDSWCINNPLPDGTSCDLDGSAGVCEAGDCVCPTGADAVSARLRQEDPLWCTTPEDANCLCGGEAGTPLFRDHHLSANPGLALFGLFRTLASMPVSVSPASVGALSRSWRAKPHVLGLQLVRRNLHQLEFRWERIRPMD